MQENTPLRILFSPVGKSDPIHGCYDGPCLHIIRRYRLRKVQLFLTAELAPLERTEHRFTKPIRRVAPGTELLAPIESDIEDPQRFDAFLRCFPQALYGLHDRYPDAEILVNISSGTPQMKMILAILATQEPWCRAVQVNNPDHRADRKNDSTTPVDDLVEQNLDDLDDAEDRCVEPPLRALHFYADKSRIESLIAQYDYHAAFLLARSNPEVPAAVATLLEHADLRLRLQTQRARAVLAQYAGVRLFPFDDQELPLIEYFLAIQVDARTQQYSNVLVKTVPFLYDALRLFLRQRTTIDIRAFSAREHGQWTVYKDDLRAYDPALLAWLDERSRARHQGKPFLRVSALSARYLMDFILYAAAHGKAKDGADLAPMQAALSKLDATEGVFRSRNEVAHNVTNIDDDGAFSARAGIRPHELVGLLFTILCQLCDADRLKNIRNIYDRLNGWIRDALVAAGET